ncbi:hypothetical protein AB0442_28490 [Kitasatospora sp. NPDC085895]|uniref:hypothetical protein n=1 Tax=Kitasatospora sp. NPDC085895 TaxID=3155057 RepID=UPI0034506906
MEQPDPYAVLQEWLAAGRGKHGRALQGTAPTRYGADVRDWLHFTEETTGIGAWQATEDTAKTWAYAQALRPPPQGEPSRRPLAPRVSLHNPARQLAVLSVLLRLRRGSRAHPGAAVQPSRAADGAHRAPHTAPLSLEQAAAMLCAADDLAPGRQRRGPYEVALYRDRLLVYLRPRQAVGIDLEDLHEEDPYRRVRTLTCPAPKGDSTIVHQPARAVWPAIADYLPHRVDGQRPATGRRPPAVLMRRAHGSRGASG